jgi:hypothetical protein
VPSPRADLLRLWLNREEMLLLERIVEAKALAAEVKAAGQLSEAGEHGAKLQVAEASIREAAPYRNALKVLSEVRHEKTFYTATLNPSPLNEHPNPTQSAG